MNISKLAGMSSHSLKSSLTGATRRPFSQVISKRTAETQVSFYHQVYNNLNL